MNTRVSRFICSLLVLACILAVRTPAQAGNHAAHYIFLFIGDGMGVNQRRAAELYLVAAAGSRPGASQSPRLLMNTFPVQGFTSTSAAGMAITDSAAAVTAIACGQKTAPGVLGMDATATEALPTIAEIAKHNGLKVGIVTNVSIDHATPAGFYAHTPSRTNYYAIGKALAQSGFDFFAGGPFLQPEGASGGQTNLVDLAKSAGYTIVGDRSGLRSLRPNQGKVLFLANKTEDDNSLAYELDRSPNQLSLAELTRKGIEILDNPDGFFIMVEGGKIDWAGHAEDTATAVQEMLGLDRAVAEAVAFYNRHPDETLIVITGDHETGGMTLFFDGSRYSTAISRLGWQKQSAVGFTRNLEERMAAQPDAGFEDVLPLIEENFGTVITNGNLTELRQAYAITNQPISPVEDDSPYGGYNPLTVTLTRMLAFQAGVEWSGHSHTSLPVQTSALGAGSELFNGSYENTDIFTRLKTAAGFGP
jgi:alkaline phosphatase